MRQSVKLNPRLSTIVLESLENEDMGAVKEIEHVFYGKISDANQLAELAKQPFVTKVLQEQSQGKVVTGGAGEGTTLRVRRINRESCVMTTKVFVPGKAGMDEETKEINGPLFDFMARVFGQGMAKMRYIIAPEGQPKLELDVFLDAHGNALGYAKFDFTVTTQEEAPPPLPLTLTDLKHLNPFNCTDVDRAALREFMNQMTFKTV
jgi:CYTH domain-containing protein